MTEQELFDKYRAERPYLFEGICHSDFEAYSDMVKQSLSYKLFCAGTLWQEALNMLAQKFFGWLK